MADLYESKDGSWSGAFDKLPDHAEPGVHRCVWYVRTQTLLAGGSAEVFCQYEACVWLKLTDESDVQCLLCVCVCMRACTRALNTVQCENYCMNHVLVAVC